MSALLLWIALSFGVQVGTAPTLVAAADRLLPEAAPEKDASEKLRQAEESLHGKNRHETMKLAAFFLHEWNQYQTLARIFSDQKSTPRPEAVRAYQIARRLKPTGIIDAPTLVRLGEDFELFQKLRLSNAISLIGQANPIWVDLPGYESVTVEGTWVIVNQASARPLQTSTIRCYRGAQQCDETTVIISSDRGSVSVVEAEYKVLSWEHDGVRAASSTSSCVDYVIHIRRVEKEPGKHIPGLVTGHRTIKASGQSLFGEPCERMLTSQLWATQRISQNGGPYDPPSVSLLGAYISARDCIAWLEKTAGGHQSDSRAWTQETLDRYLKEPGGQITHIKWQCLPDTIDPRERK